MNERRILRLPEVVKLVGYRRTSIYSFMKQGSFPKPHNLGPRAVGWDSEDVQNWINSKLQAASSETPNQ